MLCTLTSFQETFALALFPVGAQVISACYLQEMIPCPIRVGVQLLDGTSASVVLRTARNRGGVEREALVFPVLSRLGLPVPAVLAGPICDPDDTEGKAMSLHSLVTGKTLQTWSEMGGTGLEFAMEQLIEAVSRLHAVTDALLQTEIASKLPRKTLTSELTALQRSGNPWMKERLVETAIARLAPVVEAVETPLAFSNGDYQPANFLSDGNRLTGFWVSRRHVLKTRYIPWHGILSTGSIRCITVG